MNPLPRLWTVTKCCLISAIGFYRFGPRAGRALSHFNRRMAEFNLVASRAAVNPRETLQAVADACQELNVEKFDVYGDASQPNSWLRQFEGEVAAYVHKEDGLFLPSGTMGQSIVLKVAEEQRGQRLGQFIVHYSSHILLHENDGYEKLLQMQPIIVAAKPDVLEQPPLLYADVKDLLDQSPTPVCLILEVPHREIGGKITPYEDLVKISQHCRRVGVHFHMDGARFWEASAAYSQSIEEVAQLFDSMYLSFYKGLGGITGAMLVGSSSFIAACRPWLRRFGGNVYSLLPYAVSGWQKFRAHRDDFHQRRARMRDVVAFLTKELAAPAGKESWIRFDPPVPEVSLIHAYLRGGDMDRLLAIKQRVYDETKITLFFRLGKPVLPQLQDSVYFEFNMGPANGAIPNEVWLRGWKLFEKYCFEDVATATPDSNLAA